MIHITDFNGDIIDFISKSDGAVTEAEHMINVEDKLETFDFTVLTSRTEHMQKRNRVIIEDKDGQYREFIIYNISSDLNGYTRVQTNASALEDIKTAKPVPPHKLDKHTVKQALEYALADTGWEVSDEAEWGGTRTTSWTGWHDRISILKQLETTYDMRLSFHVEVGSNKITNRYVSLNKVEPMFNGEEIVYGDNMINLKRTVDFSDIATALICLGPQDNESGKREIVEVKDDDAQAQFGLPYRYIWDIYEPQSSNENMTKKRLTTLGRTALNKRKQESISYEIDGIGLSASAGDMIRVKNEDFTPELYVDAEVVEVTTDLISGESQYKFGVIKEYTRDDVYARFNAMLGNLRERLNKVVENTDSIISERLEEELKYVERYIEKSPTPPLNPKEGQLWLDLSHDGVAVLKRYENGEWIKSSVSDVKEIGGMTREETMYEALKERFVRNEVDYSEVFKRHGALVSEKHYHYVDEDIKNDLTSRYNSLQQSYDDFKIAFNNINTEQPTIGLITTAISRAVEFETNLKEYNDSYYIARKSFDEVIGVLQSQYSEEKFNEAMEEVANAIGGTFDGINIIADIPNQEELDSLNQSIKQYLNGELSSLDGKLGKQIETVINQAKDEFSVAIDSVENKVDGIEIGGRNLLPKFTDERWSGINPKHLLDDYTMFTPGGYGLSIRINLKLEPNTKYTFTFNTDYNRWYMNKLLDDGSTQLWKFNSNGGYEIVTFETDDHTEYQLLINTWSQNVSLDRKLWNLKLEKGNVATDFSPAPEDYDNKINNLSQEVTKNSSALNVLDNKINLKVDSDTVKQMLDSELNAVKSNVQTNQSELKLLSNQISSKVEKSEYTTDMNGITQDISNTKSEVSQLSESVNSKITGIDKQLSDQDETLTKHETEIEQNKLGLNTKVGYTEMNGTQKTLEKLLTEFSQTADGFNFRVDSNGMIQDLTFDRNSFKLNSNLIEFNDGDVVIKDGRTTIKDAYIDKLFSKTAFIEQLKAVDIDLNRATITGGDSTNNIKLDHQSIMSYGTFTRSWGGETDTANLELGLYDGQMRMRNLDTGYRLYLTERGLSTSMEGAIDEFTSGTLEFHSQRFNKNSRGVTMHSSYGAVAMVSDYSTAYIRSNLTANIESNEYSVYIRPYRLSRLGTNEFRFWVKDAPVGEQTDGVLTYGRHDGDWGAGLRFMKSVSDTIIYATNNNGDIGTGSVHAEAFIGELRPRASYNYLRAERTRFVMPGTSSTNYSEIQFSKGYLNSLSYHGDGDMYIGVSTNELRITNNLHWNGGQTGFRPIRASAFNQGSSLFYKTNIKNIENIGLSVIRDLTVVEYDLIEDIKNNIENRKQLGFIAEYSESIATIDNTAIDIYRLSAYNTKAIQELAHENDKLKKRIEKLEELING